jgi:hypothetical protein
MKYVFSRALCLVGGQSVSPPGEKNAAEFGKAEHQQQYQGRYHQRGLSCRRASFGRQVWRDQHDIPRDTFKLGLYF